MSGRAVLALCLSCFFPASLLAQGTLVIVDHPIPLPRPIPQSVPRPSYVLKELQLQATIKDQIARVQVSQTFKNTGSTPMEVQFVFPLPYDGAIDSLTLMVDGREYPAQLLPAKEARSRYEAIVRSNKDPALLEYVGTGMFQSSVFPVPAGTERQLSITYSQLLRSSSGLVDFLIPLSTAKYTAEPVGKVDLQVRIESEQPIKNIYSPSHAVDIQRPDPRIATVRYTRTQETPGQDFRLFYDSGNAELATRLISHKPRDNEDGYFLLLVSPPALPLSAERPKKTVLFVVDKSGSMAGKKMEQAQAALKFVLGNLHEGDLFNIIAYEGTVESFRPELEAYSDTTRVAAQNYVDGLRAGGGTNIHEALAKAMEQVTLSDRPTYLMFLTDGLPTVGVTGEGAIAAAAKSTNKAQVRLLPFGVGYDVNSRLLDRLARENHGLSEYVRPSDDIEAHVARVFSRIASPVMTDVSVEIHLHSVDSASSGINRSYPKEVVDLFADEQVVVVGRYAKSGPGQVEIRGKVAGQERSFKIPVELTNHAGSSSASFIEKLWASRRIGELIDQLDLQGKNEELVKELVQLSTQYGILTPYTSFLADENARPGALAERESLRRAATGVLSLGIANGESGFAQRAEKARFQNSVQAPSAATPFGGAAVRGLERDQSVVTDAVRTGGKDALYARQQTLNGRATKVLVTPETAALDLEQAGASVMTVDRFSDDYFRLVAENSPEENLLLVQQQADEELVVKWRGQVYRIK